MKPTKIYGFHNGPAHRDAFAFAMAETGEVVASHFCSNEYFARHDLGMDGTCTWKHDIYNARYPGGWEVEFVPCEQVLTHPGLNEAYRLNQLNAAAHDLATESALEDGLEAEAEMRKARGEGVYE